MASSQARSKNSAPRPFGQASTRNDSQSNRLSSQSFKINATRGKITASTSRTSSQRQSLYGTSANKGMSTAKYTTSNAYKAPTAVSSQTKQWYDVKEQQTTRQQPDAMLLEPEVVFEWRDITELEADVIVCPVGRMLETTAGISKVVMEKAGSGLKKIFMEKKRKEGMLPVGHTFVTGCFNLSKCKHVIHVVVPKMRENDNLSTCISDLEKAFDNCFEELRNVQKRAPAGKGKVETLAIPALGAGTNKIPKELVAEVMCNEVRKFLGRRRSLAPHLRKIFLVSLNLEMLSLLEKEWNAVIGPTSSRDAKAAKSDDKGSGKSGSTWHDMPISNDKGDGGSGKYGSQIDPVGARGGVTYDVDHHSYGKDSPSKPSTTWYDPSSFSDRSDLTGDSPLHLHSQDALVARGGTSGDRESKNFLLSDKVNQSKERDHFRSTNGGTSYDTDSDSDSKLGACGGTRGPKGHKGYPPNGHMDRLQERNSFCTTTGQASGKTDSDSDSENEKATFDRTKSLTIKDKESCPICFDPIVGKNLESLPMCGHKVCKDCWKKLQLHNPVCPVCRKVYGELRGNQPEKSKMSVKTDQYIHLPGYERLGTIVIDYVVPDGRQTEEHPNPRKPYKGTQRRAYLPNSAEGKEVLRLLEKAFKARLIFTIGRSVTSGSEDVVTWNDIHHKTNISGQEFGYPDPTYLTRVKEELAAKGIK